jgi:hypothetical protein
MEKSFQIVALELSLFSHLFTKNNEELEKIGIRRLQVNEKPGFPCRVSLADAEIGETVLLLPYIHHETSSPYKASGPIFVREKTQTSHPKIAEIPIMFNHRLLSLRAYDKSGMMLDANVINGTELKENIMEMFKNINIEYLQIHNARPGCFNCSVVRT